jgi:hypothetical protein
MATTKKKSTALALATAGELLPEDVDFDEMLENLEEMDEIDFPRIRFRQGKFYFSDDQEDKGVEEFEGVVFFYGKQNTFWEGNYDPSNITPPICSSVDGKVGLLPRDTSGAFGGCKTCVHNQFGSGVGKGKACRNQVKLYIQRIGTTVPMTLFLAPTSIGSFMQNYLMNKVTQKGLSYSKVVTKISSFQKDSETYFRINFEVASVFKGEDAVQVKKLRDFWMTAIKSDRTRLDSSVVGSNDDAPASATSTVEPRQVVPVAGVADVSDDEEEPPF